MKTKEQEPFDWQMPENVITLKPGTYRVSVPIKRLPDGAEIVGMFTIEKETQFEYPPQPRRLDRLA